MQLDVVESQVENKAIAQTLPVTSFSPASTFWIPRNDREIALVVGPLRGHLIDLFVGVNVVRYGLELQCYEDHNHGSTRGLRRPRHKSAFIRLS